MKRLLFLALVICAALCTSCKEHFSDGERVGTVTKFSKAGVIWDSWDGDLNLTQTGMNSAGEPFSFSFDNDRSDQDSLINLMCDAQRYGWKVKIKYHQVWGFKNVCWNRGENSYFVDGVEILDKDFAKPLGNKNGFDCVSNMLDNDSNNAPLGTKDNPLYIVLKKDTFKISK